MRLRSSSQEAETRVRHFFHAFRDRPDLILRVRAIAEGGSNADMLQDLSDLHVPGNPNLPLLQAINMDVNMLGAAETTARDLSDVLAPTASGSTAATPNCCATKPSPT